MGSSTARDERLRRYWDRASASYDRQMDFWDRRLFGDTRSWICGRARGDTLEVAVGTGINLPLYPAGVRLTGIEWSPGMLARARRRAAGLGLGADLREGDAQALDFGDAAFDTVVCTFSLCAIPDHRRAIAEMVRVLRPGGVLLLADHVAGSSWPVRAAQRLLQAVTVPMAGEHYLRRPLDHLSAHGLSVELRDRFNLGIVERLAARKPAGQPR
ncbi:ubiquinone/menaquinone biosynthesis methyltransferase [Planobispora rosea]|uniref:Ubiquinone/menaquinone biosynthesis methyltransferase n=1 Tax=Planobispora rosea TaxID=35762 RepID=A0A8J3WFU3_PLARO|nr:class I SAM-dependent methyltransferase [Planobispora rosea]GGS76300.1 ubiquinone/menaquinone biosynthesis methyltransferase [Planobispora rosea]GIH86236.1 ubiquinone/menaquinone biosynthesis methyltransferase [Planobispora rosea]